jgi:hypothetical protein
LSLSNRCGACKKDFARKKTLDSHKCDVGGVDQGHKFDDEELVLVYEIPEGDDDVDDAEEERMLEVQDITFS